ncbi:MAG: hypothetical protein MUO88_01485 [Desulfobacterales bacterium]|nr:hypothetical protein [Desulfobacterales bacterium]
MNEHVYKKLYDSCDPDKFALNDTGDGYICLFWDNSHALTCLRMAIHVKEFLDKELPKHNKNIKLEGDIFELDYGVAIHSGGSTIARTTFIKDKLELSKDFIFGIVANSVSRLESFTKTYVDYKVIVTGNYKEVFQGQAESNKIKSLFSDGTGPYTVSLGRLKIKDGKGNPKKGHKENSKKGHKENSKKGHIVYALTDDFLNIFKKKFINNQITTA